MRNRGALPALNRRDVIRLRQMRKLGASYKHLTGVFAVHRDVIYRVIYRLGAYHWHSNRDVRCK